MSYFDDNEERIYGRTERPSMPRGIGRPKVSDPGYDVGQGESVEVIKVSPTGKAVLIRMPDNDEMWFPFSQIHSDSEINEGSCIPEFTGKMIVTTWIAQQKDLIDGDGF